MAGPNKILLLVTGEPPPTVRARCGTFADMFARALGPFELEPVDARADPLPRPSAAALLITGSSASVVDRAPWVLRAEAWLRDVVAAGTPTLGVCFGHQLLAQALGGEVRRNPRGREMSTVSIEPLAPDALLDGLPSPFLANACHRDTVVAPPPGAVVLARSALDDHQILRFGEGTYGVQFHPEFDGDVMRGYVAARAAELRDEGLDPALLEARAGDAAHGASVLERFVDGFVSKR
jgi:GMP synthase (glutamine-hydrolysing)